MTVTLEPAERTRLRQFLVRRFSDDDLGDLAFDLGIEYESLPHETTRAFSRELISYCERRGLLGRLVTRALELRPDDDLVWLSAKFIRCEPLYTSNARPPISVIIVDDHPMIWDVLRAYIEKSEDIAVIVCTGDGEEAVALAQERLPDVVLMDLVLDFSKIDGIEATRRISEINPVCRILVLSGYHDDAHVFRALQAGAMGYVVKDAPREEILDAIRAVARGQPVFDYHICEKLRCFMTSVNEDVLPPETDPGFTPRQQEVLDRLAEGLSNQEIANLLCISPATVKNHVSNILQKLRLSDRSQARFWMLQHQAGKTFKVA